MFLLIFRLAPAQDFSAYAKKIFVSGRDSLRYRILFPPHYDSGKKYPVIVFLHGSGDRGSDNEKQLSKAASFFLKDSIRNIFPAIVIFPQCPANATWSRFSFFYDSIRKQPDLIFTFQKTPTVPSRLVKELLDSLIRLNVANGMRMYIGGLSLGGFGTYDFIERYPLYFAAAFPICGGGDTSYAKRIAQITPMWIFHGSADPVVSVRYARQYVEALKRYGGTVRYSEYPGVRHNSWVNAFGEPGLIEWLKSNMIPVH